MVADRRATLWQDPHYEDTSKQSRCVAERRSDAQFLDRQSAAAPVTRIDAQRGHKFGTRVQNGYMLSFPDRVAPVGAAKLGLGQLGIARRLRVRSDRQTVTRRACTAEVRAFRVKNRFYMPDGLSAPPSALPAWLRQHRNRN